MRKVLSITVTAVALTAGLSGPVRATDIYKGGTITHRHGAWETSETLTRDGKVPMCYATIGGRDRFFSFNFQGPASFFFHLSKQGWNLPTGTQVDVNMQVDNAPVITYPMEAVKVPEGTLLEYDFTDHVNPKTGELYVVEFINLLKNGLTVKFFFPEGTEAAWSGPLTGSSDAIADMSQCMNAIQATASNGPTQPGGTQPGSQTTQPGQQQLPDTELKDRQPTYQKL